MLLSKYINGTIFIDDKRDDVKNLIEYFENYNILSKYINPGEFSEESDYNIAGARLVFLDLQYEFSGNAEIGRAVNILRMLSDQGTKNIILVIWSLHSNQTDEVIEEINKKMKKNKPLIILDAKKEDCINIGIEEFSPKMDKLFEDSIKKEPLKYNLLEWEKSTFYASRDTVNNILNLSYNEENNDFEIEKVLNAMNNTYGDYNSIKYNFPYIHDILSDNIMKYSEQIDNITFPFEKVTDVELRLKINTLQIIKKDELDKSNPGDVYKYDLDESSKQEILEDILEGLSCKVKPEQVIPIQLDITPPCTFLKKDDSILIKGIIIENYNDSIRKELKRCQQNFLITYYYEYDGNKNNILIFDFIETNCINRNEIKFEKIFCLKKEFRSSVQQQFGSFLTRIGDNVIHDIK